MPRLGKQYDIEMEITSKSKSDYTTDEYFELDLPVAPAIMVEEEIVVEGSDIKEEELEKIICQHLGLPEPKPQKKGFLDRMLNR